MLDCVIRGGTVVDGTGAPAFRADVGVHDGRIVAVGAIEDAGTRTVDAFELVVCPGFVDLHTHYDAQIMWDPYATPSCLHGVTTLIGGNCGFTIAPLGTDAAEYLGPMLAVVEGMPLASLEQGLDWAWHSFGDWLDRVDGRLGVNAGFLVGHSALRRAVMGPDAVGMAASPAQIEQMVRLLHESIGAGGLGFSSSWGQTHVDADAQPVPSRAADTEELVTLAAAAGEHAGTTLAFMPGVPPLSADAIDAMIRMSHAADRPLNWNLFRLIENDRDAAEARLAPSVRAASTVLACWRCSSHPFRRPCSRS
jgi:N-acyl-D-aspartate/D-glutamate deacylase